MRRDGVFSDSLSARLSDLRAGLLKPNVFDALSRPWDGGIVGRTSSNWLTEVAGEDVMDEKLGETSRSCAEGECALRVGVCPPSPMLLSSIVTFTSTSSCSASEDASEVTEDKEVRPVEVVERGGDVTVMEETDDVRDVDSSTENDDCLLPDAL